MDSELARLATYRRWTPRRSVMPSELAQAGFYHDPRGRHPMVHNSGAYQRASNPETHNHHGATHHNASAHNASPGVIRCYACDLVIDDAAWADERRRDPSLIHSHRRPSCPHVMGTGRNRPLRDQSPVLGEHYSRYAIADMSDHPCMRLPPMVPPINAACFLPTDSWDIDKNNTHLYPGIANMMTRLDTFKACPYTLVISPKELAKAGFFFKDQGQGHAEGQIVCFHCGGSIDGAQHRAPGKDALSVLKEHMRGSGARCTVAADLRRQLEAMKRGHCRGD